MPLTAAEAAATKRAFLKYDADASGVIDTSELRAAMISLGLNPTPEELDRMMAELDIDRSGGIEYSEFLTIIERQKAAQAGAEADADTVEAFVALGGKADRSGCVSVEKLRRTIAEFDLTIDINKTLESMDKDSNGVVDFAEFKQLLASA